MKPAELLSLLDECYRDKLGLRQRHVAAARLVDHSAYTNTSQYIIAREDTHLEWLMRALADLGGTPAEAPEPTVSASGRGAKRLEGILPAIEGRDRWALSIAVFAACF